MKYLELFPRGSEERWRGSESTRLGESKEPKMFKFPRLNLQITTMGEEKEWGGSVGGVLGFATVQRGVFIGSGLVGSSDGVSELPTCSKIFLPRTPGRK